MKSLLALLLISTFSCASFAAPATAPTDASTEGPEIQEKPAAKNEPAVIAQGEPDVKIQVGSRHGPSLLHPFAVHGTLALGYLAPFKRGLGVTYARSSTWIWDLSYLKGGLNFGIGGIDFGGFDENLLSLNGRYYPWSGSFNWIIGIARHAYRVYLGNEFVARLTGGPGSIDILGVETLGLQVGLGNTFRFGEHFFLGIDWLTFNIPFTTLKTESPAADAYTNANDRRLVDDAMGFMRRLPTASFLKTSLGFSF